MPESETEQKCKSQFHELAETICAALDNISSIQDEEKKREWIEEAAENFKTIAYQLAGVKRNDERTDDL